MLLERRVLELTKENWILKAQIRGVFDSYGIRAEETLSGVAVDRILASMPSNEQILAFGNRSLSRRDSFEMDPPSHGSRYSDEPSMKRPKLEPEPVAASPDEWTSPSPAASNAAAKSEDDAWGRETEEDEASRPPTRQETDDWGALNLTSSHSSDHGFEACSSLSASDNPTFSHSMRSSSSSSASSASHSPINRLLPHKLRFKHSFEDHLSHEESDENSG
jgi:hypothetical protein